MVTFKPKDEQPVKRRRPACLGGAGPVDAVLARWTRRPSGHGRLSGLALGLVALTSALLPGFGRRGARRTAAVGRFGYDIHGIVTIVSDARLPELARFGVDAPIADPLIRVRLAQVRSVGTGAVRLGANRTRVHYRERLGSLGFAAEIELGERIGIIACPPLGRSPHVLYTKVVEPVLRWVFVERGYAMVIAACLACDQHAFLITARTAAPRTMTALRALDRLPCSFLSDHHALVAADGRVLTYPEPVTINRRTLAAVKTPALRRRDRVALLLQTRLHSGVGRRLGAIASKVGLPAATLNMLVHVVVPPPQYPVERLLPGARSKTEARLAAVTVIQSKADEESFGRPDLADAVEILLADPEGSDGLPPDPFLKPWLYMRDGIDLRDVEREIVIMAIADAPMHLLDGLAGRSELVVQRIVEQCARPRAAVASAAVVAAAGKEEP